MMPVKLPTCSTSWYCLPYVAIADANAITTVPDRNSLRDGHPEQVAHPSVVEPL
jgi:hypothetical protein